MSDIFSRTRALIGSDAVERLRNSHVALFGLGGVGSACFEALLRSGVGTIEVFDQDCFSESNLNRQLLASMDTIGVDKAQAAKDRARAINPEAKIIAHKMFYLPENADSVDMSRFDYVIDAVDTVTAKLEIICRAGDTGTPVISCMGTGNKLDITALRVSDISKTTDCPLSRVMRKELRQRGIKELKVVWSAEKPYMAEPTGELKGERPAPASAIFVPAAAGLILAAEVVKDLTKKET